MVGKGEAMFPWLLKAMYPLLPIHTNLRPYQ